MPRLNTWIVAGVAAFAVVAVLYVILVRDVHASKPASLAALAQDQSPQAMPEVGFTR